jgi:hypothetical protein
MHSPRFVSIIYPTVFSFFLFLIPVVMFLFVVHGLWHNTVVLSSFVFLNRVMWGWIALMVLIGTIVQWVTLWMTAFVFLSRAKTAWHEYWDSLADGESAGA